MEYSIGEKLYMKKSLELLLFKPISSGATYLIKNETIKSALTLFCIGWITVRGLYLINGIHVKAWQSIHISYLDTFVGFNLSSYLIDFTYRLFLSILIAFICWIVMRIWVKVDFLKVFMVTLVISALNFFVTIPNILVFNLVKKISIDSLFWGKTIYDFVHFLVGLFEIYVYFLFTVLLYRLTNLNKWGIAIFLSVLLVGISIIFEPLEAFFS